VAGSGDHIKALVRSHASDDDAEFYAVAGQIAAAEARRGHMRVANDRSARSTLPGGEPVARAVTPIAQPRGDLAGLVTVHRFRRLGSVTGGEDVVLPRSDRRMG
jgi:hypothetical protein